MKTCKKCSFPLGVRPNTKDVEGVCMACINTERKKLIDFEERQEWLTDYIRLNQTNDTYDCLIAVSGGKDSHMIVKRLIERHGVKNPLLVSVTDEFTHTEAGKHNIDNLVTRYDLDHITFRCQPKTFKEHTKDDFILELHPLKWIEEKIYSVPIDIARKFGIKIVFYGENSAFEYGTSETLDIFHPATTDELNVIFLGAIYPYSIADSLEQAKSIGFKDLDYFGEWPRQGSIEQYSQIDSIAYIMQLWTKYPKYGFQRVTDMACRMVREGTLTKEEAEILIDINDYRCDPMAKADFCNTIGITEDYFDEIVDRHANTDIVKKDKNGNWKRK